LDWKDRIASHNIPTERVTTMNQPTKKGALYSVPLDINAAYARLSPGQQDPNYIARGFSCIVTGLFDNATGLLDIIRGIG
jgi:hypothetical protein